MQLVPTVNSVGGSTPQSTVVMRDYLGKPRTVVVDQDDCFMYHSDNLVTFTLISSMFKSDLYHLIVKAIANERATGGYLKIM